jgi:hypothetical protein
MFQLDLAHLTQGSNDGRLRRRLYAIKYEYFGGWSTESSVVLDYIDPTVLARRSKWFFFGWLTPWGGQPTINPPNGDNWQTDDPPLLCKRS